MWQRLTIGKKIGLGFVLIIILLITVVLMSNIGVGRIAEDSGQVIGSNEMLRWVTEKEIAHLDWISGVNGLITDSEVTDLDVQLDPKACSLGKWLYGDQRQAATELIPSLVALFKALEESHRALHESVARVKQVFVQADTNFPHTLVEREVALLKWTASLRDVLIKKKSALDLPAISDQTDLGQWLTSPEARKAYQNGSPDLKKTFDQLSESHQILLETALAIGDNLPAFAQIEKTADTRLAVREEWTRISTEIFATLAQVRRKHILPALEKFRTQGNLTAVLRWSDIERSLNTDLSLIMLAAGQSVNQLSLEDSTRLPQILDKNRVSINQGLAAWKTVAGSLPELATSTKAIEKLAGMWVVGGLRYHQAVMDESNALSMIDDAHYIFEAETFPKLQETVGHLNNLKKMAAKALQGMDSAKNIFNNETLVAAQTVRLNLQRIGKEMRNHLVTDQVMLETVEKVRSSVTIAGLFSVLVAVLVAVLMARSIVTVLRTISGKIDQGAAEFASAAAQISAASYVLARGAGSQAASIEETSASLEEIETMARQSSGHADLARSLMEETKVTTRVANDSMDELENSMAQISSASADTANIVKTIDEIAFQTNLLALNAAVEAARAGEAGAGFAVVADEVRNLAIRAAEAARDTSLLIENTVVKVHDGSKLMNKTNDDFDKVEESVHKVGDLIGDISNASREQTDSIGQLNKAVSEVDAITQQNAATAEESASSAAEMNAQIEEMRTLATDLMTLVGGVSKSTQSAIDKQTEANAPDEKGSDHPPSISRTALLQSEETKTVAPEQLITFDSEEDFKDF